MRKLVLQSDFGLGDGAVSAMKGIAYGVNGELTVEDITHDISTFNIWEASYRLHQVTKFWPEGTVFVSVVDPGVGSARKSVVARLSGNRFVVTPDNGTLSHLKSTGQIEELREIDESVNRVKGSEQSHTFHGRDVYAFTGARLASEAINFEGVGAVHRLDEVVVLKKDKPSRTGDSIIGTVEILDVRFGHLWSDIPVASLEELKLNYGDRIEVEVSREGKNLFSGALPYCRSFSDVNIGDRLCYVNSMLTLAVGIHQESFSKEYGVEAGPEWKIKITRKQK